MTSPPGIDQSVAHEATVSDLLTLRKTPTICVYDLRKLNGAMMMDLMRAHPLTVVNGVLYENPFFHARGRAPGRAPRALRSVLSGG